MAAIDAAVMAVSRDNADDTAVLPPPPDEEDSSVAATADTLVASSDTDDIVVREAANRKQYCYIDLKSKLGNGSNKQRVNQNSSS